MRDGLYGGSQTVTDTDNGDGTVTQTTSYDNTAFNAITASIATLSGGLAAGLAGANAQAGATWAENEVLNNTLSQKSIIEPGENPEQVNEHTFTLQPLQQSGGATDEEQAGDTPTVAAGAVAAGAAGATNSIATPYGPALQSSSPAALNAISQVQQGATLFRIGTLGQSQAAEAQFWSLQNPLTTPNYPGLYGIPPENVTNANFVETATLTPGTPFITRPAPPVGTNPGGGEEG